MTSQFNPLSAHNLEFALGKGPVLIMAATPGDEVRGCGGTSLRHRKAGDRVKLLVISRGHGVVQEALHQENLGDSSAIATGEAARLMGLEKPILWTESEASLGYGERLIHRLGEILSAFGPSLVYAPFVTDPDVNRANLGLAALEAVRRYPVRCQLAMYETGVPQAADTYLDISECMTEKRAALALFDLPSNHGMGGEVILALNKYRAGRLGNGCLAAEAFKVISSRELMQPTRSLGLNIVRQIMIDNIGPLVSIIIRTTNRVELADALSSIATQTYRHIEVILVDVEGRGDLPGNDWCGQFPLRVAATGSHLDRGAACNVGLDAAGGDYVAFLDDDDWLLPDHVASLLAALQASPHDKAAYAGVICLREKDDGSWETVRTYNDPYDPTRLLLENYLPMHSVMFARSLLVNDVHFDESLEVYEDWDFWIQLSLNTSFIHVDRVTAVYRISHNSGFAVRDGEEKALRGLQAILEKWRPRWTLDQLTAISLYPNLQLRLARAAAEQERNAAEEKKIKAEQEKIKAEQEKRKVEKERARAEKGFGEAEQERFKAEYKLSVTEEELAVINEGVAMRDAKINELIRTNATLYFKNAEFQREAQEAKDRLKEQQNLHSSLGITLKTARQEAARLARLNRSLRSQLSSIQDSPAWSLTRGLHLLTRRLPGPANSLAKFLKYSWYTATLTLTSKLAERRIEGQLLGSGLFDTQWYLEQYPEVILTGFRPTYHWISQGWHQGLNPHPAFDTLWYLSEVKEKLPDNSNPLLHYLERGRLGIVPHPLFDPAWYLGQCPEIADIDLDPLRHFLEQSPKARLSPHPLFDSSWYLSQNPDVAENGVNPFLHYLISGWREGRSPHFLFKTDWYLGEYPDVAESGIDPLRHYLVQGGLEGRSPHPLFDGAWYLREYPRIHDQKINPLVDFVVEGAWEGRNPNPWFDTSWYLQQYPEVLLQGINPLRHYIQYGRQMGLNPGPAFDGAWYLREYPDVDASGINPLEHFVLRGLKEGRSPLPKSKPQARVAAQTQMAGFDYSQLTADTDINEQVPEHPASLSAADLPLRALAFYLPQFHPIPENDRWWGPGFTEWTNVTKAHPQYLGHHQPRLPGALGFYDLRLVEVQREQVRLAHKYGLYGFCYHYYWFGGHRLLDRPLRQVLADPSLDLPFCLCWANENWTRRWDGQEQDVLIGQQHSPADDLAFIAALEPIFRDPRYIRVDDKPLLLVYRPQLLPDPAATVARWRQHVQAQGLPGLFLAAVQSFSDAIDTDDTLFDALVEFPPHTVPRIDIGDRYQLLNPRFRGEILDYEACVDAAEAQVHQVSDKVVFPGVMAAWDNTPRRRDLATIFANASPQAYGRWLTAACRRALAAPAADHRLVFINAWNEWAEGSYLEPDQRYGHAYLQATRDVLLDAAQGFPAANAAEVARHLQAAASPQLLVVGHDAHRHGAQLLTLHLLRLFARRFGYRPRLWLLGDGALRPDYEAVAEVRLVEDFSDSLAEVAGRLRAHGIRGAIVNTVVSAAVLPALASAGLRTLALIHEMPKLIYERGLEANAQAVVAHADQAIFASTTVLDAFCTVAPIAAERALILPQGIYQTLTAPPDARAQVAQELGLPPGTILVINVGYGDARKGFDLFLDAARLTVAADARCHFLWLGQIEASFVARLERERQTLPLAGHLHQVPFTAEVGRYYQAADLFLLSSREDPFPSVVLEALACGLPVIAFAGSGGHCELLAAEPLNGALVALGQVRALAQSLRDQAALEAQDPERRSRRAAAARARFDFVAYGWELLRQLDPQLQRVSVVVPNYNYAHYLRARLESIFGQAYPVYEILVLDDASTDTSLQVLETCRRDWQRDLTLVTNDHNSGSVFAQWRQGIARAQGDLVWLAEADDLASPDFLASLAPHFATQPDLAFAFSDAAQIDDQGRCLGESYAAYCNEYSDLDYRQDFAVPGAAFLAQGLGVRNTVLNVSGVLFRRSALQAALDRVGPALSDWRIAGDWRLYIELCRAGGAIQYVARPLNQHRRHAASVVGANRLDQHLAEITAMHAELGPDLATAPGLARRQRDYRESLRRQARQEAKNASA